MKPPPFIPEMFDGDERYFRDKTGGLVWHRCKQRTLYADTDRSQIVYHANHLRYFEFGRTSLMRDIAYPYREIEESGYVYPVIEIGDKDLGLFLPVDEPQQGFDAIKNFYNENGLEGLPNIKETHPLL